MKFYSEALLTVIFLGISLRICGQNVTLKIGDKAPPLYVQQWLKGNPVNNFEGGHIYVLEFSATFCAPCRLVAPHLTELSKQYEGKVTFISLHIWENMKDKPNDLSYITRVGNYVESMGNKIGFPVAVDVPEQTTANAWMNAADVSAIPMSFIVDGFGDIVWIGSPFLIDGPLKQVVSGVSESVTDMGQQEMKKRKHEEEALKVGDTMPPLTISKWLTGNPVTFEQRKKANRDFAYVVIVTKGRVSMHDRKNIHLMTKLAREYSDVVDIVWIYSGSNQKEVENFVEELGEKIGFGVALDTPEHPTYNNWNKAAGRVPITAFIIDHSFHIVWFGSPQHVESVLKGGIMTNGVSAGEKIDQKRKQVFTLLNEIIDSSKNGDYSAKVRIDSLISANPEIQYLYCAKYQYFYSHEETRESKEEAEAWLKWMLEAMPKNYFYWEYVLSDILHAFKKHQHNYFDLLTSVIDRTIEESETDSVAADLVRQKAKIYAEFKGGVGDPEEASEVIHDFLKKSRVTSKSNNKAGLISDYYLYKLRSCDKENLRANTIIEEILSIKQEGLQWERLINCALGFKKLPEYELLLKAANRYLEETVIRTDKDNDIQYNLSNAKALATLAKVYDAGGEISNAYKNFQAALKFSELINNQNVVEYYKNLFDQFKQKHSLN